MLTATLSPLTPFQDWKSVETYYLLLKFFKICSYAKNVTSLSQTISSTLTLWCLCCRHYLCWHENQMQVYPTIYWVLMYARHQGKHFAYIAFFFYFVIILWGKDKHSHFWWGIRGSESSWYCSQIPQLVGDRAKVLTLVCFILRPGSYPLAFFVGRVWVKGFESSSGTASCIQLMQHILNSVEWKFYTHEGKG